MSYFSETSVPHSHRLNSQINHAVARRWAADASRVEAHHLMYPLFVTDDDSIHPIASLVDMNHVPASEIADYVAPLVALGLQSVIVFGVLFKGTAHKDAAGHCALRADSPVVTAIRALKERFGDTLLVAADVCLCGYTSHGHCCVFEEDNRTINQEASANQIAAVALHYAQAGADIVAPSDMMDGRIATIKAALSEHKLGASVGVMSYSAKFASSLYGPFRQAANSGPAFGDRRCYQLPPGARQIAMRAVERDLAEGADYVMVKPGGMYLDIIRETANVSKVPVAVYQVSGEYAMLHAAAAAGSVSLNDVMLESLRSMRRAGATILITYFTPLLLRYLKENPNAQ